MDDDKNQDEWIQRYEQLSPIKKAAFLAEAAARGTIYAIDKTIEHTTDVIARSVKAFEQGSDPNILEAHILDETTDRPSNADA